MPQPGLLPCLRAGEASLPSPDGPSLVGATSLASAPSPTELPPVEPTVPEAPPVTLAPPVAPAPPPPRAPPEPAEAPSPPLQAAATKKPTDPSRQTNARHCIF